jgi:hypothetical protein
MKLVYSDLYFNKHIENLKKKTFEWLCSLETYICLALSGFFL